MQNKSLLKDVPVIWLNDNITSASKALSNIPLTMADIDEAEARLARFAPFIQTVFPETKPQNGLIESLLTEIAADTTVEDVHNK